MKVFYTWGENSLDVFDPGFGIQRKWDIDFLKGYDYEFLKNTSKRPGSDHFYGIINPDLIDRVSQFAPDVIVVYGWKFHSHLSVLKYFKGRIKIYFRGDSHLLDKSLLYTIRNYFKYPLLKWVYSRVDYVLSPGRASDAYFRFYGLTRNQILRMSHAVENERFSNLTDNQQHDLRFWKKDLGLTEKQFIFLYAGKLETKKNPELLIQTFLNLHEVNPNIRLVILGSGVLEDYLRKRYDQLPNAEMPILFIPFTNQSMMPLAYRLAQVFVLPSQGPEETWGLSVNEALASGIPAIVSNRCGCHLDLIQEGLNGFIFKSNDQVDLKKAMIMSIGNYHSISSLTQTSLENFSVKQVASEFIYHILNT